MNRFIKSWINIKCNTKEELIKLFQLCEKYNLISKSDDIETRFKKFFKKLPLIIECKSDYETGLKHINAYHISWRNCLDGNLVEFQDFIKTMEEVKSLNSEVLEND